MPGTQCRMHAYLPSSKPALFQKSGMPVETTGEEPIRRERWWAFSFSPLYSVPGIPTAGMGPALPGTVVLPDLAFERDQTIGKDV